MVVALINTQRVIDAYFVPTTGPKRKWVLVDNNLDCRPLTKTESALAYAGKGPAAVKKIAQFFAESNVKDPRLSSFFQEYNQKHWLNPFKRIPQSIIDKIQDPNSFDSDGHTALHTQSACGELDRIRALKTNPFLQDTKGDTALHKAICAKQKDVIKYLLETPTLVFRTNFAKESPLHTAAIVGDAEIVLMLLKAGARVDAITDSGDTPLHLAILHRHSPVAKLLLEHGADTTCANAKGQLPWQVAQKSLSFCLALRLHPEKLQIGQKIGQEIGQETELHHAVLTENTAEVISLLKTKQQLIDVQDGEGHTALHIASMKGDSILVRTLLQSNASLNPLDLDDKTPLHLAKGDARDVLLQAGADVDSLDNEQRSAAFYAIEEASVAYACQLIQRMSDVSRQDSARNTLLHRAIQKRLPEVLESLFIKNADPNKKNSLGNSPLHDAVEQGQLDLAKTLIEKGGAVNDPNEDGQTIYHIACRRGFKEFSIYLQGKGAKNDALDSRGYSPLHLAALSGTIDLVTYLLQAQDAANNGPNGETLLHRVAEAGTWQLGEELCQKGFLVTATDDFGQTPLHTAAFRDNCSVIDWFIMKDPTLTQTPDAKGRLPIHCAAMLGNLDALGVLANSSPLDAPDFEGKTPLHLAIECQMNKTAIALIDRKVALDLKAMQLASSTGNLTLTTMLVERGAPIGDAVHLAVEHEHKDVVEYLLDHVEVDVTNDKQETLLHIACRKGTYAIIDLLLSRRASWKAKDTKGRTPFHILAKEGHAKVIQALIGDPHIPLNAEDAKQNRPIHLAAKENCYRTSQILIDRKCDLHARNKKEETALHVAIGRGHQKVATLYASHGLAFTDVDAELRNCLHKACLHGDVGLVEYVHAQGVDINKKDTYGQTPLMIAAGQGNEKVARFLIEKGASISEVDAKKRSALHHTCRHGHKGVAQMLCSRGASLTAKDDKQQTALHRALVHDQTELAAFFIGQKEGIDLCGGENSETALHIAAGRPNTTLIIKLLEAGADPNIKNRLYQTALHVAAGTTKEVVATLLRYSQKPIDRDARDHKDQTAYDIGPACF